MLELIKPLKLKPGDLVATVSLSWGGAGDAETRWRYDLGKKRLEEIFDLQVIEMSNTLIGREFLYHHPEKRAQDLMDAFRNPDIKAIFSCIGGEESVRMLPYIDFDVIRKNPKIFIGYSDTTISHYICLKSGLSSFYGPSVLAELAENVQIFPYTVKWLRKVLFSDTPAGLIEPSTTWTSERIPWLIENRDKEKTMFPNTGPIVLQGKGKVKGRLIGGCMEVLEMLKDTKLWPDKSAFDSVILFLETSENMPSPAYVEYWLRNYGSSGILQRINGLIWSKPYNEKYFEEYQKLIKKIVTDELGLTNLPIIYNMNFGHTEPMMILPFGCMAEMNCDNASFSLLEEAVV